ncbi:MAG: hypothetical protein HY711_05585, partial [Candidatus Melainabacteria bacterium]|nr:hypothetical protein [Candidatus Melainabacteria bacterium]
GCIEEFGGGLHPGQTDLKDPARKGGVSVERDELEQIAQRAFAISPRLGAMEGPADKVKGSDPLEELLAEASTSSPGKAEQQAEEISDVEPEAEEIFDVSLPLKEKSGRSTAYQMDEKNQGQPKDKLSPPGKQTPGTTGPPFSGGPPPRRRQS